MAANNNDRLDRELLGKLSDLAKVEESSIVATLNEQKAQAEKDRTSAETSYADVQTEIEQNEAAKTKLEDDIAKLEEILDEKAFVPFEESLGVLGLSESLKKVLEQLKKAPTKVASLAEELTKLREKEKGFDDARTEADIKVSEIDKSLPSVIGDLQGMAAFLDSALSNETGNITKNEIIGRLENISKSCPGVFTEADMDRIAQLILFPDKLIEYFKAHREEATVEDAKDKSVGEVIAVAMAAQEEETPVLTTEEPAPSVEEVVEEQDEMKEELERSALSFSNFSEEEIQIMREGYQPGIIEGNVYIMGNNFMDFEPGMPVELLVTPDLEKKIETIIGKGKSLIDIKNAIAVLLLPLETIKDLDLENMPLWTATNPLAKETAQENEETLLAHGITLDEEDKRKYYPLMSTVPAKDFADNMDLLKGYNISIIKKNKKPAIRIVAQQPLVLQHKLDAAIEQGNMDNVKASPEILGNEMKDVPIKASSVVSGDSVANYEKQPANINEEEIDIGKQLAWKQMLNHFIDYVYTGTIEANDYAYIIGGHAYSRKRIERNLLRAAAAGVEDENVAFQIAIADGAFVEPYSIQNAFGIMGIDVQPKAEMTQGGV